MAGFLEHRVDALESQQGRIEARLKIIEAKLRERCAQNGENSTSWTSPPPRPLDNALVPIADSVLSACKESGLVACEIKATPSDYYSWTLEQRRDYLGAPSTAYLCKSLIVENTHFDPKLAALNPNYHKYYCIIVQYVTTYMSHKLKKLIRSLPGSSIPQSAINLQFTSENDAMILTGYEPNSGHNAVTPFGSKTKLPLVLSDRIAKLDEFWLGGGHVDLKLKVKTQEFIAQLKPYVGDIIHDDPAPAARKVVPKADSDDD